MTLPYLLPATSAFIQRAPRMLIGGDWVEAADGQTMPLYNPATGEVLCVVPRATPPGETTWNPPLLIVVPLARLPDETSW